MNEKKFHNHEFGDERISKKSRSKWHAASARARIDYVNMLQIKEMEMNDSVLNLGDVFTQKETGLFIESKASREMPYTRSMHNSITFEMSMDK